MDFFRENVVLYSKSMDLGCFQGLKLEDARQNDVRLQNSIDIRCLCTSKCEDAPLKNDMRLYRFYDFITIL